MAGGPFVNPVGLLKDSLLEKLNVLADTTASAEKIVEAASLPLYIDAWLIQIEAEDFTEDDYAISRAIGAATSNVCRVLKLATQMVGLPDFPPIPEDSDTATSHGDLAIPTTENSINHPKFIIMDQNDERGVSVLLTFLFHVINDYGDDRSTNSVNIVDIAEVAVPFLYALNPLVYSQACRCLSQAAGLTEYRVPIQVIDVLRSLASCVCFEDGSGSSADVMSIKEYLNAAPGDSTYGKLQSLFANSSNLDVFENEMISLRELAFKASDRRLALSIYEHPEWRAPLLSGQAYAQAALMIMLGPIGFHCAVLKKAPRAHMALLDLCRQPILEGYPLVKTSVVEATTMSLSFTKDLSTGTVIHHWKLSPLLATLFTKNVDEFYFHQLCDLSSFMPVSVRTSLMPSAVELANDPSITPANQLRLLTTAIRGYDPTKISFRNIAKVYTSLVEGIKSSLTGQHCDLQEIYDGFSARLMIIMDGMDCDGGAAAEWGRVVLNSQLPEICTTIFDDFELLKKTPTSSILIVIDLLKRLIDGDEVRHHLFFERGILSPLLKGAQFLVQNAPSNPFLWKAVYHTVKFITKSVQDIQKSGSNSMTPVNQTQYVSLWEDVITALDLALPAHLNRVCTVYPTKELGDVSIIRFKTNNELSKLTYWTETVIDFAGKILGLVANEQREFIYILATRVVDSARVCPFNCHRLVRLLALLNDFPDFWRDIVAPQTMIASSSALFDTLLALDRPISQPVDNEFLTSLLSPLAIAGSLYPLAKGLFISLQYDTEVDDKTVFEQFLSVVPLDVLARVVFQAGRMSIHLGAMRDNFSRAAESLNLVVVLSWCKQWLLLTAEDKTDDSATVNLGYLKMWIDSFVIRQSDLQGETPACSNENYCNELQQIFDEAISFIKSLAIESNFSNLGIDVWDSVKKIHGSNILSSAVRNSLEHKIRSLLEFLMDNCGIFVIRHPIMDSLQIKPKELFKSLLTVGRLNTFMKSDPRKIIEFWEDLSLSESETENFITFAIDQALKINETLLEGNENGPRAQVKFWLRILRGLMLKDEVRSSLNVHPANLKEFNLLLQDIFNKVVAPFVSPDFFALWRDLWLIANATLKIHSKPSDLTTGQAELPACNDQIKFMMTWTEKAHLCGYEDEAFKSWDFCDFASFIWIHSFFCMKNENYNDIAMKSGALKYFLRSPLADYSLIEIQTIGRMLSDTLSLHPENLKETTLSLYNSCTRYLPYSNRSLEGISNIARESHSDPRSSLFAVLQDTIPQSVAYVGDSKSPGSKLYPQHVIKKALHLLNLSEKSSLSSDDQKHMLDQSALSSMKAFVSFTVETYSNSPRGSTQAMLSVACLSQCAQTSSLARDIIVNNHQSMIYDCLTCCEVEALYKSDDHLNCNIAFATREFILTLMELAGNERHTGEARQSLERSITITMSIIIKVLVEDVPKAVILSPEKACALWGQCVCVINSFVFSLDSNPDSKIWARETAPLNDTYTPFQFVLLQDHKIIETLTSLTTFFDFSARYFYPFRLEYLRLIELYSLNACYVYEPIKPGDPVDRDASESTGSVEADDENFLSGASLSDNTSDILDDSVVSESIIRHQNRIRSTQRNVFRNSILGEYESNSSDLEEDDGYDSIEELSDMSEDDDFGEEGSLHNHHFSSGSFSGVESASSIAMDPYGRQSVDDDEDDDSMMSDHSIENDHLPHSTTFPDFANDYEIEVIISDEESMFDSSNWSDSQVSSNPEASSGENESDISDIEVIEDDDIVDFDDTNLPVLFEEGGELMLLYGDRSALEAVEDDLGEESDELRYDDPHSDRTLQDYVDAALGSQQVENLFEDTWRQQRQPISLWDTDADGVLACKDEFFQFVNHQISEVISKPSVQLNNRNRQNDLEMMVSSPEFSLLGRKRRLRGDLAQDQKNKSQAVQTVLKFLFTYLSFRDSEFTLIKAYFKSLVAQGFGEYVLTLLFSSLFACAKGDADKVYLSLSHHSLSDNFACEIDRKSFTLNLPIVSSSAFFCGNVLKLLNFLFTIPPSGSKDSSLTKIKKLIVQVWKSHISDLLALLGTPIIARNRQLLQQSARLIDALAGLLPENIGSCKGFDGGVLLRLVQVLASEESTSTIFGSITTLFRTQLKETDLTACIVKEIKKSKNDLVALLSKMSQDNTSDVDTQLATCNALVPAGVKILRLLSVVKELCDESTIIKILKRIDFVPLWQSILDHLVPISKVQIIGSVTSLALLEIIAVPANVISKHQNKFEDNARLNDSIKDVQDDLQGFASQAFKFLCQKLVVHRAFINEMLKAKPKLCAGPLGNLAVGYDILNLEGKETILTSKLDELKDEHGYSNSLRLDIDRYNVFDTSLEAINNLSGDDIRSPIQIAFYGEIGEDAGGVAREWLEILSREITDPKRHLFVTSKGSTLQHIDPASSSVRNYSDIFKFIGRIIGRAVYDRRVINLHFNRAIYRFLKGNDVCLQDMEAVDLEYQRSLEWALNNDITDILFETFSVESYTVDGKKEIFDLIANGRNVSVTEENKHDYVKRVVTHKLVDGVRAQLEALRCGFHEIIPADVIDIFDAYELELLITGTPKIDIEDWRRHTTYVGYTSLSPQVKWFWLSVKSFDDEQRAKLLQFSTGTSRVPARGFGDLESVTNNKGFVVEKERGDTNRLPTAHTCMNQITIPCYENYKKLRNQLLLAISEGFEGFGFA